MEYVFKKDFLQYKAGDSANTHPNLEYLIRVGVVESKEIKPVIEKKKYKKGES